MSVTRTQYNSTLLDMDGKMNPEPSVGDTVRSFYSSKSIGIVIDRPTPIESTVLWNDYVNPFERLIRPAPVNYAQIANELVTVQPMTGPSALAFYLDYTFKNEDDPR